MVQAAFGHEQTKNPYLVQKVMTASPEQLVLYVFDAAIIACSRNDKGKTIQAMQVLIPALKFDYHEIASNFYNSYRGIINLVSRGEFDLAKNLIADVKKTWASAMKVE